MRTRRSRGAPRSGPARNATPSPTARRAHPDLDAGAAAPSLHAVFAASGAVFTTWASRVPQVRDQLHLTPRELGEILLALPLGALVALVLAGSAVSRWGTRRTTTAASVLAAAGLACVGAGAGHERTLIATGLVMAGLVATGLGTGVWNVAMNVAAAEVERRSGRAVLARFHASISAGTVSGAVVGTGAVAAGVSVTAHLVVVALVTALVVPASVRHLPADPSESVRARSNGALRVWAEPRTLALGLFVMTVACSEGSANDWLAIAVVDGHHAEPAVGAAGFTLFVASMTAGRWFGPRLIDCWGPVTALRVVGILAVVGLAAVVFGPGAPVALLGAVAWGLGTALGFPAGITAAARDPERAATRVSVVSAIGYTAFLAGPPLLGLVAQHTGVLRALSVTIGVLALGVLASGACRPDTADVPPSPD